LNAATVVYFRPERQTDCITQ